MDGRSQAGPGWTPCADATPARKISIASVAEIFFQNELRNQACIIEIPFISAEPRIAINFHNRAEEKGRRLV
jgi:hypothetical protein